MWLTLQPTAPNMVCKCSLLVQWTMYACMYVHCFGNCARLFGVELCFCIMSYMWVRWPRWLCHKITVWCSAYTSTSTVIMRIYWNASQKLLTSSKQSHKSSKCQKVLNTSILRSDAAMHGQMLFLSSRFYTLSEVESIFRFCSNKKPNHDFRSHQWNSP